VTASLKWAWCALALATAGCSSGTIMHGTPEQPRPVPAPPPTADRDEHGHSASVHVLGIPPGHLPHPGQCRVWIPGNPPGHQPHARACAGITATAPAGSWIVYRASANPDVVHVHVVDESRAGIVVVIRIYDAEGHWVRDESAEHHHDDWENEEDHGRGHGHRRNN
jgi:hypothetical protein